MEYGNGTNGIVFIKDFASEEETTNNALFSDWIGQSYNTHFSRNYDIRVDESYACTLIDKRPRGGTWSGKQFSKEKDAELAELICALNPTIIFAFGEGAYKFCFPNLPEKSTDFKMHGRVIHSERFNCPVGCLLRDALSKDYRHHCLQDVDNIFANAVRKQQTRLAFDFNNGNYLIESADDFALLVDSLIEEGKEIAFDYETYGTNPWSPKAKIYSVAISNRIDESWMVFIEYKNKHSAEDVEKIKSNLIKLLESNIPKIAQNLEFEWIWSKVYLKCEINNYIHDTMIGKHVIDESSGVTGLEFQTFELFGVHHKNSVNIKKLESEDEGKLVKYNNLDARITLLLKQQQYQELRQTPELKPPMDFFMSCVPALYDMKYNGIAIDVNELHRQLEISRKNVDEFQTNLEKLKTYTDFSAKYGHQLNFNSSKDMKNLLYEDLNLQPLTFTPSGKKKIAECEKHIEAAKLVDDSESVKKLKAEIKQIQKDNASTDADTIEEFAQLENVTGDARQFLDLVMSYRKHNKVLTTYLGPYLEYIQDSNIIHPTCALNTTRTYRSSYINPNLQNIPKRQEMSKEIRKVFVPKLDGFLDGDFSGAEVKVLAMLSKDPTLVNELRNGVNIHTYWAAKLFDKKECDVTKAERDSTKSNFVFLFFYGGWNASAAKALDLPLKHVKHLEEELWKKYPRIKKWQSDQMKFYTNHGYVQNPFGFRRHGPLKMREIINTPIQGTSFLLLLTGIRDTHLELKRRALKSHIVLQIHDELVIDYADSEIEETLEIADANLCKQHYDWQILPMSIDWKIGKSFGELEKI